MNNFNLYCHIKIFLFYTFFKYFNKFKINIIFKIIIQNILIVFL